MRYLLIFLFLITCSSEPSKENLIESCADNRHVNKLIKFGKMEYAYGLWIVTNLKFKDKYDSLSGYRTNTKDCENWYNENPVTFKLRFIDFRKNAKNDFKKIRDELSVEDMSKLDRMIQHMKENM